MPSKELFLAPHTIPQLFVGASILRPQNYVEAPERLRYLDGMAAYFVQELNAVRKRPPTERARRLEALRWRVPASDYLAIEETADGFSVAVRPGARDEVSFDVDRLRLGLPDGRSRATAVRTIPLGARVAAFAPLMAKLTHGATWAEVERAGRRSGVDFAAVVRRLEAEGLVQSEPPAMVLQSPAGAGDFLTFIGHAGMVYQSQGVRIAVDPAVRGRLHWKEGERATLFDDPDSGDRAWFDDLGPDSPQLCPRDLDGLEAVLITHQDSDHFDAGLLMTLPARTTIVVPEPRSDCPWDVDLKRLLARLLGKSRRVVSLGHYKSLRVGKTKVTAFPFRYEMPSSLRTGWNCYLVESSRSAVAFTADAAVTRAEVDFLRRAVGRRKELTVCARDVAGAAGRWGYRDSERHNYNFSRIWGWYVPPWDLFAPRPAAGFSTENLARLARGTRLRHFFPYAMGGAPAYRLTGEDPFAMQIAGWSAQGLRELRRDLAAISTAITIPALRYGVPFPLA